MKFTVTRGDVVLDDVAEKALRRHSGKIETLLSDFQPDETELHLSFDSIPKKEMVAVNAVLYMPEKNLSAGYQGKHPPQVITEVFHRLQRELKRELALRRAEREHSGEERPQAADFRQAAERSGVSEVIQRQFLAFLERNLSRFYNYAYREIRSQVYQGMIRPGDLTVRDVLDEATAQALQNMPSEFDENTALQQMYRYILHVVTREAQYRRLPESHIEELLEPEDIDTEMFEYYQPDEVDWLEEMIPDEHVVSPDREFEASELERRVEKLVTQLPKQWREAFVLTQYEGFGLEEAAMVQNRSTEAVQQDIEMARQFLRSRLAEMGITSAE
jgi:RNA polymerase sigma factor (sigma-70 family)